MSEYMKTNIFFYIIQGTCTHCIINISRTVTKIAKTTKYIRRETRMLLKEILEVYGLLDHAHANGKAVEEYLHGIRSDAEV